MGPHSRKLRPSKLTYTDLYYSFKQFLIVYATTILFFIVSDIYNTLIRERGVGVQVLNSSEKL